MSKIAFANHIIEKLQSSISTNGATYTSDTPINAQRAIAEAITEYLVANTTINVSYTGILTNGGTADPIASDTMKITGECAEIDKPLDFLSWVNNIQSVIASSFSVLSPGQNGITASFKPFNPSQGALIIQQKELAAASQNNQQRPSRAVWEVICGKIIDWLTSEAGKNPQAKSISAIRDKTSTGTVSLVSITIQ